MSGRPLIAVIVAAVVTIGAGAFAVGRGVASDTSSSSAAGGATTAAPQGATAVEIKDFAFAPQTVTVKVGSAVTWTNDDSSAHSVKSADGSFVSQDLDQGKTFTTTFTAPGTHAYICGIHNSMTGTITVEA